MSQLGPHKGVFVLVDALVGKFGRKLLPPFGRRRVRLTFWAGSDPF